VPSEATQSTNTSSPASNASDRLTVAPTRRGAFSAYAASAMPTVSSSSQIVTTPAPLAMVAPPVGLERMTFNVSAGSRAVSPRITTGIVIVVVSGSNVTVPAVAT